MLRASRSSNDGGRCSRCRSRSCSRRTEHRQTVPLPSPGRAFGNVSRKPAGLAAPRCRAGPGRPGRAGSSRSGRWRGSKPVTAHDLAKLFDVGRAAAGEHFGDIAEVARAQQTRTDDGEETGVNVAAVTETVDHAPRNEERLARVQVGARFADGKRSDAVQPEDGFVELVVAVRRGYARIGGDVALEDADTASGLVCVDVKTDCESPELDRLVSGVGHD